MLFVKTPKEWKTLFFIVNTLKSSINNFRLLLTIRHNVIQWATTIYQQSVKIMKFNNLKQFFGFYCLKSTIQTNFMYLIVFYRTIKHNFCVNFFLRKIKTNFLCLIVCIETINTNFKQFFIFNCFNGDNAAEILLSLCPIDTMKYKAEKIVLHFVLFFLLEAIKVNF